jgi:Rrf2 family protein
MISQKAKYALRALVALARAEPTGQTPTVGEIASAQNIPKKFLEQILLDLKHHGIVASKRGKAGGYMLLKPANRITFGEILRIVDGPIALLPCLSVVAYRRCDDCQDEQSCEVRHVFAKVAQASRDILDQTTIADSLDGGDDNPVLRMVG